MKRIHELVAAEGDLKSAYKAAMTRSQSTLADESLFEGMQRTYAPRDDSTEDLPPEEVRVREHVADVLQRTREASQPFWDLYLSKEASNQLANADVILPDGSTLLAKVPVTGLLFLERELGTLKAVVDGIPTLGAQLEWRWDDHQGFYVSAPEVRNRTVKKPVPKVITEATDRHQAQYEIFNEDVTVGTYTAHGHSGAWPVPRKRALQKRVATLLRAVKEARERANASDSQEFEAGNAIFEYLLSNEAD